MLKRIIAGSLAAILLLSCSTAAFAADSQKDVLTQDTVKDDVSGAYAGSYRDYQSANTDLPLADDPIEIKAEGEGAELYLPGDSVSFKFTVAEAGWYEPHVTYRALAGSGGDILFSLLLDGELICDQMSNLRLSRLWKNVTDDFQSDSDGNQFSPEQEEVFAWQSAKLYDSEGFITEPLRLALSEGEHELTILLDSECVKIGGMTLAQPEQLPTYEEYYKQHQGAAYQGEKLIYEDVCTYVGKKRCRCDPRGSL